MKKILLAACLLAALSCPCRCGPMPGGGRIAFVSDRDGNDEIYVMNADPSTGSGHSGGKVTNLTNHLAGDNNPAWSPDGKYMAFDSDRDRGNRTIYVMNADGSGQTKLTSDPPVDFSPAWSPVWSPDGTRIAFVSWRDGNGEVYAMNVAPSAGSGHGGSGLTNLTNHPARDEFPSWSPDGTRIAFRSDRDGNDEIYVMNADGSGQTRLTNDPGDDTFPAWSPDGSRIAFMSLRDGNDEIYVMNADPSAGSGHGGSGVTRLTDNRALDSAPTWSPDGSRIAFVSRRDGNDEIYVMNADGSEQTNLTNHPAEDRWPSWGP